MPLATMPVFRTTTMYSLAGCAVEWASESKLIVSCGRALHECDVHGESYRLLGEIPRPIGVRAVSAIRLGQRLLRELYYNVVPLRDGRLFVTYGREVGIIADGKFSALQGVVRPARILRGGCALDADGSVYWGEYFDNAHRGEIHIYRWDPVGNRASVVYTFPPGAIYHVHAVHSDPTDGSLLCLTGDRTTECRFLRSRDGFTSVETIGAGDESWRFVSLVPRQRDWLVATDAEFRQNQIALIDRETRVRTPIVETVGPVYYSAHVGNVSFFGSSAERCDVQPDPRAVLYAVCGEAVTTIQSFEKDLGKSRLLWRLFLPGTLHFPSNGGVGRSLYVSGIGVRGLDARVMRVDW